MGLLPHRIPRCRRTLPLGAMSQSTMVTGRGSLVPAVDLAWQREGLAHA